MPKVSVIVVTYNRLNYLKLAVESVMNQTFTDIEIVVVADGDQEDVKEYIESFNSDLIKYFFVPHCGYPAKARNLGISKTESPFIAFCDDDDVWEPDKLSKQISVFERGEEIVLCCTDRQAIDSNGEFIDRYNIRIIPKTPNVRNLLMTNYISYSSVVIKRSVLTFTGLFPDDVKYKAVEDYHLWIRVALFGKIFFLKEKLICYRIHPSNITTTLSKGALKNLVVFKDVFGKFEFRPTDKLNANIIARAKFFYYTMKEKLNLKTG